MLTHRCTGPSKEDPYPCGVWVNLLFGWLRIWPLRRGVCLGWWTPRRDAHILTNLKEL